MNTKYLYNILSKGAFVVIKEDNGYLVISPFKDDSGDYRTSGWSSIEIAKQYVGSFNGYLEKYYQALNAEIVEIYYPTFEPFKVGEKVKILNSIKGANDWKYEKNYPNMEGEIKEIYNDIDGLSYGVWNRDKSSWYYISNQYLIPLEADQVEEITMEELHKRLGYEVKIKK